MKAKYLKNKYERYNGKKGDVYGRLTLTGVTFIQQSFNHRGRVVEAWCSCNGAIRNYWFHLLKNGDTQSCGCLRKEVTSARAMTHDLSKHPLYEVHRKIMYRCYDDKDPSYKNYGGRGIDVCDAWADNFLNFYKWAIKNGYEEGKSVDRIDNNQGYSPNNCRFATREEQSRNKRGNRWITAFGETKCLFDWGKDERCKVDVFGLRSRLDRGKWTDMEAMISTPPTDPALELRKAKHTKQLTAFGETKCMQEWLRDKRCTVKIDSLRDRLKKGWSHEKAISYPTQNRVKGMTFVYKVQETNTKTVITPAREIKLVFDF